jgi:ankyrin repeat protein
MQDGSTALHSAAYSGASNELLRTLIEAGGDVTLKNKLGKTPIDRAIDNKKYETAQFLESCLPMAKPAHRIV